MSQSTTRIMENVSDTIAVFRERHNEESIAGAKDEPKVAVNETVSKMAYVYEKLRQAIDYQEEHLIRKNAIARILKRRIFVSDRPAHMAAPLIRELIRAGYLPNKYFPERRLPDVESIIVKYVYLIDAITRTMPDPKIRRRLHNWTLSVMSFEIEDYLKPSIRDDAMVELMYKTLHEQVDLSKDIFNPEDRDIQIYIAIHRALIKSDSAMLRYHLLYYYAPQWRFSTPTEAVPFAQTLPDLMNRIESQINHPVNDRLYNYMKRFGPIFTVLKDVFQNFPDRADQIVGDPNQLEQAVHDACNKRYTTAAAKLSRGVVRSIIYIFLTKTILAFTLELPYEIIFLKHVKFLPLIINVTFHPILMFLIATSMRVPADENTRIILQGIRELVYDLPEKEILKKRQRTVRSSGVLNTIFNILYALAFIISFSAIIWVLMSLEFSIVSGLLFLFFLSVISFFGLRLRQTAKELVILDRRDNSLNIIFDFFALPVLRVGRWISRKTSKVNVFMFIMDFIIEAPFKLLVETTEDWVSFQEQKKEETF
ncbi:MAG: hypothetical protein HZC01_02040 [Candidatus Kerfeldbacteria bacterium]|nr:hypothetical protein [Candidatus Kerfeldbacteria bacterium]